MNHIEWLNTLGFVVPLRVKVPPGDLELTAAAAGLTVLLPRSSSASESSSVSNKVSTELAILTTRLIVVCHKLHNCQYNPAQLLILLLLADTINISPDNI